MSTDVSSEIISIGTEILLGEITDTNSVFIARVLRDLGINIYMMSSVGDNRKRIADAIQGGLSRADIIITCGGLGPTVDDMTRQSVADATERGLTFHQELLDQIAERFESFKMKMSENNRQQAYLPDNAIAVENPVGTAPAFIVEQDGKCVISLPGVPREMKYLMNEKIVPYLRNKYHLGIIKARVLKTAGIGESTLDEVLGRDLLEQSNPTIGLAAHTGQIDVRITAKAPSVEEANALIEKTEAEVMARVGDYIFGADETTLDDVFVQVLKEKGVKVAVVQVGVGDLIAKTLTDAGADSDQLIESQVFQNPLALRDAHHLSQEMNLRELTRAVAEATKQRSGADMVMVVVSDPDIDEGADSAEATVIAVYSNDRYRDRVYGFGAQSDFARIWGKSWLLSASWHLLKDNK
jgi:nicotinamide-nucleotide amidase